MWHTTRQYRRLIMNIGSRSLLGKGWRLSEICRFELLDLFVKILCVNPLIDLHALIYTSWVIEGEFCFDAVWPSHVNSLFSFRCLTLILACGCLWDFVHSGTHAGTRASHLNGAPCRILLNYDIWHFWLIHVDIFRRPGDLRGLACHSLISTSVSIWGWYQLGRRLDKVLILV